MEWDPHKLQVDTLRPNDPRLRVGTIAADKIVAGVLEWDCNLVAPLLEEGEEGSS